MDKNDPHADWIQSALDELYWLVLVSTLSGRTNGGSPRQRALMSELIELAQSGHEHLFIEVPVTMDLADAAGKWVRCGQKRRTKPRWN